MLRSTREAIAALLEQGEMVSSGDYVSVGSPKQPVASGQIVYGRVMDERDPELRGRRPSPGKIFVKDVKGGIQEYDPKDLVKQGAAKIPPDKLQTLSTPAIDNKAVVEVLQDLVNRSKKRRADDPFKDREKSLTQRFAQRNPLTRLKKSNKMKKVWRGTKDRMSYTGGGLRQESLEEQEGFPDNAGDETEIALPIGEPDRTMGQEPTSLDSTDVMSSEDDWYVTQRTFELADDIIRALSVHKGMIYFEEMKDDPQAGIVKVTLAGTAPREVVDSFLADASRELDIEIIEEPEGTLEDKDLKGKWVIQGMVLPEEIGLEDEEEEFGANEDQYNNKKYPNEIDVDAIGQETGRTEPEAGYAA